jgi:hypothetical protein
MADIPIAIDDPVKDDGILSMHTILVNIGIEFPSLGGILVSIPKQLNSDIMDYDSDHVFINNPYCKSQHDILKKLSNYSMATTCKLDHFTIRFFRIWSSHMI